MFGSPLSLDVSTYAYVEAAISAGLWVLALSLANDYQPSDHWQLFDRLLLPAVQSHAVRSGDTVTYTLEPKLRTPLVFRYHPTVFVGFWESPSSKRNSLSGEL